VRIAEIYSSIQGEGLLAGTPSAFVRTSGCNLRCWFCDTPYASWQPEGDDLSVRDVLDRVLELEPAHVVLTGGEPMLWAELVPLARELRAAGRHVTIETAGTLDLPVECDLLSLSPKLAGSGPPAGSDPRWTARHEQDRHAPAVVRRLVRDYEYQVKFVIDAPADCDAVETYLGELPEIDRARVLLMPQGRTAEELSARAAWLEPHCAAAGLRFCPRKQIQWFGLRRGT
jgi:7-carboxy-7-deazaguanine synthase